MNIILALVPAVAYGAVSPLVARMGERPVQQLMKTALGVLLLSSALFVFTRPRLDPLVGIGCFISGLFWGAGTLLQYRSFRMMGTNRAFVLQTAFQLSINAVVGVAVFGEWSRPGAIGFGVLALLVILAGASLAGTAEGADAAQSGSYSARGCLMCAVVGALFVANGIAPRFVGAAGFDAVLPQAVGAVVISFGVGVIDWRKRAGGATPNREFFENKSLVGLLPGVVWCVGNTALIFSNMVNGTVLGFSFAQLCVAVNCLLSVVVLHEIEGGRALARAFVGIALIVLGAVLLAANNC